MDAGGTAGPLHTQIDARCGLLPAQGPDCAARGPALLYALEFEFLPMPGHDGAFHAKLPQPFGQG